MKQASKRARRRAKRHASMLKPGTAPGALHSDPEAQHPRLRVFGIGSEEYLETELATVDEIRPLLERWPVLWLDVVGLGNASAVERIGEIFGIHRLALEDAQTPEQRAKADAYDDALFVVLRRLAPDEPTRSEQMSLFVRQGCIVTFQERAADGLDPVRERIRQGKGRIRRGGADYIAYALIDAVIDVYLPHVEAIGERLEALEERALVGADPQVVAEIHQLKCELSEIRRVIFPLREAISVLMLESTGAISAETRVFLRDCQDHVAEALDLVATFRDSASDLMTACLASANNRLGEVMKLLTLISTIFIPLSFIASVYGMNFDRTESPWNMPELGWRLGYPFALALMAGLAAAMLFYFRRKGWLGKR